MLYSMLTGGPPFGRDGAFNEYAERLVNDLLAPWRRRCIWARGRIGTLPTTYVGAALPGHCW
ncbi:hypothetical protein [Micromonospora fulviviridis]|uniref:hypothetical protein n=1 Tax=Micromonospora fulviviridis TaxID=47860 RepID=UPI003787862B